MNAAGGVLGEPVVWVDGDDGTNPNTAKATVARQDSYGEGLQGNVRAELERAGHGSGQVRLFAYDPPPNPDSPPVNFTSSAHEITQFARTRY